MFCFEANSQSKSIMSLVDSTNKYMYSNYEYASKMIDSALHLSNAVDNPFLTTKVLIAKARLLHFNGLSEEGRNLLFRAIAFVEEAKDESLKAELYDNLGLNLRNSFRFEEATKYYNRALEIRRNINDSLGIANILLNLGCLERDLAGKFLDENKLDADSLQTYSKDTIRLIRNQFKKAFMYFDSTKNILKKYPNQKMENELIFLIGSLQYNLDYYKKAQLNLFRFADLEKIEKGKVDSRTLLILSNLYFDIGNKDRSKEFLDSAIKNFPATASIDTKDHFYMQLAEHYYRFKDYEKAFKYLQKSIDFKRLVFFNDAQNTISKSQSDYENSLQKIRENQLESETKYQELRVENRNYLILVITLATILIFIFLVISMRNSKKLALNNKLIEEQNDKITQMSVVKDKLYSVLAHDIKNPLIGLDKELEKLMNSNAFNDPEINSKIKNIYASSSELISLFNNLYDWANLESGDLDLNIKKLDLNEVVQKVINVNQTLATSKGIVIENKITEELSVLADYNTFFAIIHNLIHNAIKFSNENGEVTISHRVDGNKVWLTVTDNGIGSAAKSIDELIENKNHLDKEAKKNKGSGLGLRVIKEFVECNGGAIFMESKPGLGSKFYFSLDSYNSMKSFKK